MGGEGVAFEQVRVLIRRGRAHHGVLVGFMLCANSGERGFELRWLIEQAKRQCFTPFPPKPSDVPKTHPDVFRLWRKVEACAPEHRVERVPRPV